MAKICHITSVHKRNDIRIFVKECCSLARAGHEISLIVADELSDEIISGVSIYSVGKQSSRRKRILSTPKDISNKIRQINPEYVHFHDPELMLIGRKLAKDGYKVIYDVHEDLPKQVLNKYWLPKITRKPISMMVTKLEKICSKHFYGIIAATPIIAKRFLKYNLNTIDVCNYPILSELNISYSNWENRNNNLCYIGSISKTRGIESIVASLALSKQILDLAGIFSGDITIDQLKAKEGGKYINYLGVLDRTEIANLLQKVKIGMVTLLPTPSYMESLPIKMFEYMLAGIPIIASNFPLWQEILLKYECGVLVNPEDPKQIADSAIWLLNNQDKAKQMGENGRNAVIKHFNWEHEQEKLIHFYK